MEPIPKSGYYYPNRLALIILEALEEVMGKNGLYAILNQAHLSNLIDNYPSADLERQYDFADVSAITLGLEGMYGQRGGRGLALRAGRAAFADTLRNFGAMAGVGDLAFKVLSLNQKMKVGLPAMAKIYTQISDQHTTVEDHDTELHFIIHRCPICWGRQDEQRPVCYLYVGLLQEAMKWISGGSEFRVNESDCVAASDDVCRFVIQKEPFG